MVQQARLKLIVLCVAAATAQLASPAARADSGIGVDTVLGNALNPRTFSSVGRSDPEGLSDIENSRSPTGFLNLEPRLIREPTRTASGWLYTGNVEFGAITSKGDNKAAKYREYEDFSSGGVINTFGFQLEKPEGGWFVNLIGGGVFRDDQYYGASIGRYNDWSIKGFYTETPHVFTTTFRNLWNGVGHENLSLKPGLNPAGNTGAQIQAAVLNTPYSDLSVTREKGGARFDMNLRGNWKAFASYTLEHREGERPFGMALGFGQNVEIPESVKNETHDVLAGVQWGDSLNSLNLSLKYSLFRNDIDELTVENPLTVGARLPRFDMHPDNKYYNLKGEYAHLFPGAWNARITALVSASKFKNDDSLISYGIAPGTVLGNWNTLDSLSRRKSGAEIDTRLIDLGLSLNPVSALGVKGKVRLYKTDNDTNYLACNPTTGQWGRAYLDGNSNGLAVLRPGFPTTCNPDDMKGWLNGAGNAAIRNAPYEYEQKNYSLAADYRINTHNSINAEYEREEYDREHRERDETDEDKFKLGYVNRSLERGTLRLSFEHDRRRGSRYSANAVLWEDNSAYFTAYPPTGLPVVGPNFNINSFIFTATDGRKFDLADRNQNILKARFNYALLDNLDGGITLQLNDARYPNSDIGRDDRQKLNTFNVDLNWQRSESLSMYGFYTYQDGRISQTTMHTKGACPISAAQLAGITNHAMLEAFIDACAMVGPAGSTTTAYNLNQMWMADHKDKTDGLGFGLNYDFGKVKWDLNYTWSKGRTEIDEKYMDPTGAGVGLTAITKPLADRGFSTLSFVQHAIEANLLIPLNKVTSLRLLYRYERGKIDDWHYDGIDTNPVPAAGAQVMLDAGPENYSASLIGIMLRSEF